MNDYSTIDTNLVTILSIFEKSRQQLIFDFLNEETEIYSAMFRYEEDELAMKLSIEKYFIQWINTHFTNTESCKDGFFDGELSLEFGEVMVKLIDSIQPNTKNINKSNSSLMRKILIEKVHILKEFSEVNNRNEQNYKKLLYAKDKDNRLFDRQFKTLIGKNNELT